MMSYWILTANIETTIQYETWLAGFIQRRVDMFNDKNTFWGRYRLALMDLEQQADFAPDAYYPIPSDPFVVLPDYCRIHILRRRYLNRLRMRLLKKARQEFWTKR